MSIFETLDYIGYLYKKVRIWHNAATNLFTRVAWLVLFVYLVWILKEYNGNNGIWISKLVIV